MTRILLTFVLGVTIPSLHAQLSFSHLESEFGMTMVLSLHRDSNGYLWIGDQRAGLFRYDGSALKSYRYSANQEDSITEGEVLDIYEDVDKQLWVATRFGLNRYNRKYDSFIQYQHAPNDPGSIARGAVYSILESPDQELWMLTPKALSRYDKENDRFIRYEVSPDQLNKSYFQSFIFDSQGRIWLLEAGNRIWQFHPNSETFESSPAALNPQQMPKRFYKDQSGTLWIGTSKDGLAKFFPDTKSLYKFDIAEDGTGISGKRVRGILEYPEGQLLIAISQKGLNILDIETGRFRYQSISNGNGNGLSSDGLITLHKDQEDILWVSGYQTGIDYYNPKLKQFTTYRKETNQIETSLAGNFVTSLHEDHNGQVVIGTDGGGISILDPDTNTFQTISKDPSDPDSLRSNIIYGIDQSSDGRLWAVTWDQGIHALVYSNGRYQIDRSVEERLKAYETLDLMGLVVDKKDRLWFPQTSRKLQMLDKDLNLILEFMPPSINPGTTMPFITETQQGEILYSHVNGVYRYDESSNEMQLFISLDNLTVVAFEPQSETYYVGTSDRGLLSYDRNGNVIDRFGAEQGLSHPYVQSIQAISKDEIWIATDNGLNRLDLKQKKIDGFYESDGLQGNLYFEGASYETKDGHLYFGGTNGFSKFHPEKLITNPLPPQVSIDQISLFGKPLDFRGPEALIDVHPQALEQLNLNWRQNQLLFEFSGISMTSAHKNQYAYKLEGFDKDWTHTSSTQRTANYTNLDPGSYVFRVKASNNVGVWNEKGASLRIEITPPYWQRPWFYLLVAGLSGAFIYGFILNRERKLKNEKTKLAGIVEEKTKELIVHQKQLETHQEQLEETVEIRTKELVTAKDKAEESDRLKSQFLANLSHEIRTPLNAIAGFSSLIATGKFNQKKHQRYSNLVVENSNSLLALIDDILDLSMIETNQLKIESSAFSLNKFIDNQHSSFALRENDKEIDHQIDNTLHKEDLWLTGDRSRIKQVINNLMTNAYKFTKQGFVKIGVYRNLNTVCFYVEDSGPGIPKKESELIFETFVKRQVDDLAARRGVGLGLAICKRLSQLMEGDLTLESEVGKGSTFTLSLPLRLAKRIEPIDEVIQKSPRPTGKRILVIEDEPTNYEYLEVCLTDMGFDVVLAKSGEKGIATLQTDPTFDLILLDIKMPGIDGFETLKQIRVINSNIRVIAQTACTMKGEENKIRHAGFDDYLAKPISFNALSEAVEQI